MDKLLDKFSLQTFLRQFFCGVVFFVPIWFFARESLGELSNIQNWKIGTLGLFTALASIIGTIIYHLEKNLWSYPMQWLHRKEKLPATRIYIGWIIVDVIIVCFLPYPLFVMGLFLVTFVVIVVIVGVIANESVRARLDTPSRDFRMVLEDTWKCWCLEDSFYGDCKKANENQDEEFARSVAIAGKVATWSDFIHCVQSCCFAWILGSCLVLALEEHCTTKIDWAPCEMCGDVCTIVQTKTESALMCKEVGLCSIFQQSEIAERLDFRVGMGIAIFVLALEFLIDRHRYFHVKEMIKVFKNIKIITKFRQTNITEDNKDYLYRITDIKNIIHSMKEKKFVFRRMDAWRDKCSEGFEYQFYDIKGNRTDGDKFADSIYASSWTEESKECTAFWELLSPKYTGVRVKVRKSKVVDLVESVRSKLKETVREAPMIATPSYYFSYAFVHPRRRTLCLDQMFARFQVPFTNQVPSLSDLIGGLYKVEYLPNLSLKTIQKLSRAPFILKHEAYSYEKEIRALFYCDKSLQNPKDPDSYIVDLPNPPDFYEEFLFDSRLSDCVFIRYKRVLNECYGIELSKIKKSTVFDQPEIIRVKD